MPDLFHGECTDIISVPETWASKQGTTSLFLNGFLLSEGITGKVLFALNDNVHFCPLSVWKLKHGFP